MRSLLFAWIAMCIGYFTSPGVNAQTLCCDSTICFNEAAGYTQRFIEITSSPVFMLAPISEKEAKDSLDEIKKRDPEIYKRFEEETRSYARWFGDNTRSQSLCFNSHLIGVHDNTMNWVMQTTSILNKTKEYSSEFCKGFRFQLEGGSGVKDIGRESESFIGTLSGLLTYTFAPYDPIAAADTIYDTPMCDGNFRIGLGVSGSYVDRSYIAQGLLRMEYRLMDLRTDFFTVGNVKAILQGAYGINRDYHAISVGVGLDLEFIGFNLLFGLGDSDIHSLIQPSIVYHFKRF